MTTKELLAAKREELDAASDANYRANAVINGARRDMEYAAKKRIDLFLNCSDDMKALALTHNRLVQLQAEVRDLEDKAATERETPYPLGTLLYLWEYKHAWDGLRRYRYEKTKQSGVVELVTSKTQHPDNLSIGALIVRPRKKDGSPSKSYVIFQERPRYQVWRPEGVDPNFQLEQEESEKARLEIQEKRDAEAKLANEMMAGFYGGAK
jgi:hypothetical protein